MTEKLPLVSVLMPVYNAAPYVKDAIDSILNQTFADFELLVFNDGSTDSSAEVIESIKDKRIVFIDSAKNFGYVAHLNNGLQLARGKYIARMDADDIALPTRFEKQIAFLEANSEVGLCGTSFRTFGASEIVVSVPEGNEEIREFLLRNSPMAHPTVIFRKALVEQHSLHYDKDFMPTEDYKLWYDISKLTKLHNITEVLLYYRVHPHQISSYMNDTQRANADKVRVLQLTDKGFDLTPDEQQIYCHILQYSPLPQTAVELEGWRLVMRKIIAENRKLHAYNELWFDHIFMTAWREAASRIEKYTLSHLWPLLVQPKPTSKSFSVGIGLRIAAKCLVQWKARPVSVS